MVLPNNFSSWEHLQTVLMQTQNRVVREEFNDVGDDTWEEDINTPRASLRVACTLRDSDSAIETELKLWLFYGILRKARDFHPPIYGIPSDIFQEELSFYPQVILYFSQDWDAVPEGRTPVQAEMGFRLMGESPASMTETKAKTLAQQIRTEFANSSQGYIWSKGKHKVTYQDKANGYLLSVNAISEDEAEQVIKKILAIQNHLFDSDKMTLHTPKKNSLNNPSGTVLVYGQQKKKLRWRPTANVRFRYATLHLHGLPRPIALMDRTGYFPDALVKA